MGRAAVLTSVGTLALALALGIASSPLVAGSETPQAASPTGSVELRILGVPGHAADPRVREHVEFGVACGFNAVWITTGAPAERPPTGKLLDLLAGWEARGLRVFVEVLAASEQRPFADRATREDLRRFVALVHERAQVRDFVVSFDGAALDLTDLADLDAYGRSAAPAHLDLVRGLARATPRDTRLWLRPAVSSDAGLADPALPYAAALLEGLRRVPRRVGIVWSGTAPASVSVDADAVRRSRAKLGDRPMLLADRFPYNGSGSRVPLALVLGALRERDPAIARELAGYLALPMAELGASRLALLTVADFLRDPSTYDPDRSWHAAIARLAGDDPAVREALETQALEWGGWIGGRNYHTADTANPHSAAAALGDPAAVASWTWVVRRYPERMEALARAADRTFADDVLLVMARRLAVARAVPLVVEIQARRSAGRTDLDALESQIAAERSRLDGRPDVRLALDRFLAVAGIRVQRPIDPALPDAASEILP